MGTLPVAPFFMEAKTLPQDKLVPESSLPCPLIGQVGSRK